MVDFNVLTWNMTIPLFRHANISQIVLGILSRLGILIENDDSIYPRWKTVMVGCFVKNLSLLCHTTSLPCVLTENRRWLSSENVRLKQNKSHNM